jgi:hypothetical protein
MKTDQAKKFTYNSNNQEPIALSVFFYIRPDNILDVESIRMYADGKIEKLINDYLEQKNSIIAHKTQIIDAFKRWVEELEVKE